MKDREASSYFIGLQVYKRTRVWIGCLRRRSSKMS